MAPTPYELMGGDAVVVRVAERFYDVMERDEPALTAVHKTDEAGRILQVSRDRFGLFLIGWLGGPQTYQERYGHPRLRMRHGHVAIGTELRDAWMRCMVKSLDDNGITGDVRSFVEIRLGEVATFLRNVDEGQG